MIFKSREEAIIYKKKQKSEGKLVTIKKVSFIDLAREIVWFVEPKKESIYENVYC